MMRKIAAIGALATAAIAAPAQTPDDPLLRPIAPDYARRWLDPHPVTRLHGQSWFIGYRGLSMAVIRTSRGLILIDGALPQTVRETQDRMRAAGFDPRQVKLILVTEAHYDHAGGVAALARDSGATVVVGREAVAEHRTGKPDAADPQHADLHPIPASTRVRAARDGQAIRLGDTVVTAHATPGHTAGSMSWSWKSCEGGQCATILFAASQNAISSDGYRFTDHPERVAMFRRAAARMRGLSCDLLVTSHPDERLLAGMRKLDQSRSPNPLIDPAACRRFADGAEAKLDARLKDERGG
ncbi:subclass B3 metallo-beta-lactamase [Sphingomonas sp. CJ99]